MYNGITDMVSITTTLGPEGVQYSIMFGILFSYGHEQHAEDTQLEFLAKLLLFFTSPVV